MRLALVALVVGLLAGLVGAQTRLAPDGSWIGGGTPQLAPNSAWVGGRPELAPNGAWVGGHPQLAPDGWVGGGRPARKFSDRPRFAPGFQLVCLSATCAARDRPMET